MSETVTASTTRVVNASCEKVWRAQTDPQYFEQWFGAKPGSVEADVRSGGSWSAVITPGGQEIKLDGRYLEVLDNRKLVMTIPNGPAYAEITIVLTDLGDRTEITSSTRFQLRRSRPPSGPPDQSWTPWPLSPKPFESCPDTFIGRTKLLGAGRSGPASRRGGPSGEPNAATPSTQPDTSILIRFAPSPAFFAALCTMR